MASEYITLGVSLPANIAITIGLALGIVLLSALIFFALPVRDGKDRLSDTGALGFLNVFAAILAPIWLFLFAHILWALYQLAATFEPTEDGKDLRWHILAFIGLVTALGGLISAPLALIRVWTTERQTRTSEQGHMTDRISKAVEQLGEEKTVKEVVDGQTVERTVPNIEVRIGGLLSLERIAQDSTTYDKGRDHVRVMEILCAYVRENAPAKSAIDFPEPDWEPLKEGATDEEREAHFAARQMRFGDYWLEAKACKWAQALPNPRADIQQALDIFGRRTKEQRAIEARWGKDAAPEATWVFDAACPSLPDTPSEDALSAEALTAYRAELREWKGHIESYRGYRLDLRGANLQGADLSGAILSGARLNKTRLEGADLREARLEGADLGEARLEGADLALARMMGADLSEARMESAFLVCTRFEGAFLVMARMEGAVLSMAHLENASIARSQMEWADLSEARLEGADLIEARLEAADLEWARLEGASLERARLEGTDLGRARLEGADLGRTSMDNSTNLTEALLRGASVRSVEDTETIAQLSPFLGEMFGDGSVKLPKGTERPAHWPDWELPSRGPNEFHTQWKLWLSDPENYTPPPKPAD
ncbi:pentapeptide repeat-containing protein [Rhodobacteraceae bacterium 63075]|nr:pentapeptide repeat-containing protein [Rhodobacteraceae bacterium 63075]